MTNIVATISPSLPITCSGYCYLLTCLNQIVLVLTCSSRLFFNGRTSQLGITWWKCHLWLDAKASLSHKCINTNIVFTE